MSRSALARGKAELRRAKRESVRARRETVQRSEVELSADLAASLEALRSSLGLGSRADALRAAIPLALRLVSEIRRGGRLVLRRRDGSECELLVSAPGSEVAA